MKKGLFLVVLVTAVSLLTSCATMSGVSHEPLPNKFYSLSDINIWIYHNIEYDSIPRTIDTHQTPQKTLQKRSGVCIDMAFLFVKIAKDNGWSDCKVLPIQYVKTKTYHCLVDCGMLGIYDPTNGLKADMYNNYPKYVITTWE